MPSAGGLYVEIVPTFVGGIDKIVADIVNPASQAGSEAGARIGQGIVDNAGKAGAEAGRTIMTGITESTAQIGVDVGRVLSTQLTEQSKAAAQLAGDELRAGLTAGATEGAAAAGDAILSGVTKGAQEASAAAESALAAGGTKAGEAAGTGAGTWFERTFAPKATAAADMLVTDLRAKVDAAAANVGKAEYSLSSARAAEEKATASVNVAEQKLLETRVKYADNSSQVLAAESKLSTSKDAVSLASQKTQLATENLSRAQSSHASVVGDLEAAEKRSVTSTDGLNSAFKNLSPGVSGMVSQYKDLGVLMGTTFAVGAVGAAVKSAGDFQASQERLVTTAGEVKGNLTQVSDGILQMAGQVGISAQDLSKGMYTVESAGYHGADSLKVMQAAAQGAKMENADLTTVTDAVTSAMQDYHLGADQAATVTSKMITAVSDGKTTFQDITGAMSAVLPVASSLGIGMNEVLGDLSSMTLHGMSADQAAQNLANSMRSLSNPTAAMTKEMAALGLNSADLSKNLGKTGVQGTMEEVSQAILSKMGPAGTTLLNAFNQSKQAAGDAATMFANLPPKVQDLAKQLQAGTIDQHQWTQGLKGVSVEQANLATQWLTMDKRANGFSDALKTGGNASQDFTTALAKATGNSTSMNVALMLTGENADKTKQNIADVGKATTETGNNVKGWGDIQGQFNLTLDKAKANLGAMAISIGEKVLPFVTKAAAAFGDFAKWISQNTTVVMTFVGVLGALGSAMLIVKTVQAAVAGFQAWRKAIQEATTAQEALNVAMKGNMIGIIVVAIAALVAGLVYAYGHVKWFHDAVNATVSAIANFFKGAFDWIKKILADVVDFFKSAFDFVKQIIADVVAWVSNHWKLLAVIFGILMLPITLLVGAIFLLATHWKQITQAIADAAVWLYQTILKPIFDGIVLVLKIVGAVIFTVLVTPFVLAFKLLAAAADLAWKTLLKPTFDAIGNALRWLYDNVAKPVFGLLEQAWHNAVANIEWVWNSILKPAWKAVEDAANWLYQNALKPVFDLLVQGWHNAISSIEWVWNSILKPAWQAVEDGANWLYNNALKPVFQFIHDAWDNEIHGIVNIWETILKPAWQAIENAAKWLWENALKPVFDFIGHAWSDTISGIEKIWNGTLKVVFDAVSGAVHLVGQAFDTAVSWIKDTWNKLEDIAKVPVNFVISTVYNGGIVPTWNAIAGIFGLGQLQKIPALAEGGALGGGNEWDAVGSGFVTNGPRAIVGEGNPNYPEYVIPTDPAHRDRAKGLYGALGQDIGMFASGGILGGVSNILGGIGNLATSAWNGMTDAFSWISGIAGNVTGGVSKLFQPIVSTLSGMALPDGAKGGSFKQALEDVPQQVIGAVVNTVKGFFSSQSAAGGATGTPYSGPISGGVQQWSNDALQALKMIGQGPQWLATVLRRMNQESGGNPNVVNTWDANAKAGHPSIGLMQVIQPTFDAYHVAGTANNIYDPLANIAAGLNYAEHRYGSLSALNQAGGYDNGGYLQPGYGQVVYNGTGSPEPVFTSAQWSVLKANIGTNNGGSSGGNTINVYADASRSGTSIAHEVDRHLSRGTRTNINF